MTIVQVTTGSLFDSDAQTLVNTVNTVGVMGKGIALEFKKRFPEMYLDYVQRCERGEVVPGEPYVYRHLLTPWVINFPTKRHWRARSRPSDIIHGLEFLVAHCTEWGVESLAVPPLGCGNGGLHWTDIGPTIYKSLDDLGIPVSLFAPDDTPSIELTSEFLSK